VSHSSTAYFYAQNITWVRDFWRIITLFFHSAV
jgi:hypothetical protein